MNKLTDQEQARKDAAMLAAEGANPNVGIRRPDEAANAADRNLTPLSGISDDGEGAV